MSTPTKLITYEDSLTMPENRLEEIVHGESRIMPPPHQNHVYLIEELAGILRAQLDARTYRVTHSGAGLGIERIPLTYRIPDLMVFRNDALRVARERIAKKDPYIWAVPELIVECLSPSNRKGSLHELLAGYSQINVPEVWLLDAILPRWTAYRFESGGLNETPPVASGIVHPSRLPGVTVNLEDLWIAYGN